MLEWTSGTHEMEMALEFDEIMADSTQTSELTIYISPMTNEADTIDIDDFLLELAPPEAFEKSCDSLLLNGRADFSRRHAYPFYPTGGLLNVASDGTGPAGIAYFFRSTLRSSQWSSALSQDIASACLRKTAVYDFSAYVRVHSFVERRVSFSLRVEGGDGGTVEHSIVECPPSSGEWVSCSSKMRWEEDAVADVSARLHARVPGGDDAPDLDVADVYMTYAGGRAIKLTLEDTAGVKECWGPGADVLVTSHTIRHADYQLATISSVDLDGAITLAEPIHRPITMEEDRETAVEVALLSRNIIFSSAKDDEEDLLHGCHFMVMHMSAPVVQRIVGIETRGNSQQGKLGECMMFGAG